MMSSGGQLPAHSGVAINASMGYGNYNAGFASRQDDRVERFDDAVELHLVQGAGNRSLGAGYQRYTPDDPFNLDDDVRPQFYDRKFVYNTFFVIQPPFYKGQQGLMGRVLGGWTFSSIFTAGSGQPLQMWPSNFTTQSFGEGDSGDNYLSLETGVPIGPVPSHGHAYYNTVSGGLPVNLFKNPAAAFANYRNPILGLDTRDTSFLTGLPYWNLDFSIRKNVRVTESVALEFQGNFVNILNHDQWLDPSQPGACSPAPPLRGHSAACLGQPRELWVATGRSRWPPGSASNLTAFEGATAWRPPPPSPVPTDQPRRFPDPALYRKSYYYSTKRSFLLQEPHK